MNCLSTVLKICGMTHLQQQLFLDMDEGEFIKRIHRTKTIRERGKNIRMREVLHH